MEKQVESENERLKVLSSRQCNLQILANEIAYPAGIEIDYQAFPYENLYERYNFAPKRLKRIQRLYRVVHEEWKEILEFLIEQGKSITNA